MLVDALKGEKRRLTSLHLAAEHGQYQAARPSLYYFKNNRNVKCYPNFNSETPLIILITMLLSGYSEVAAVLLDHGANLTLTTADRSTALHFAARSRTEPVLRGILEKVGLNPCSGAY